MKVQFTFKKIPITRREWEMIILSLLFGMVVGTLIMLPGELGYVSW